MYRIEVRTAIDLVFDDTERYKQFSADPRFKQWLSDTMFNQTCQALR